MQTGKHALVYVKIGTHLTLVLGLVGLEFPNLCVLCTPEAELKCMTLTKLENVCTS